MQRRARWVMFAPALGFALAACNGILGIDAPTLVEAGGSDAKPRDGGARDATTSDARKDGPDGSAHDATTSDARLDGRVEAMTDGHVDASHDAPSASDARIFDGNCNCDGDACAPILVERLNGHVSALAATGTGVYFSNDINAPTYGVVGFVPFGGTGPTILEPDAALPGSLAVRGATVYWVDSFAGAIDTCTGAHCTPQPFVLDALQYGAPLGVTGAAVFWSDPAGIHACPFSGCEDGGVEVDLPGSKNGLLALNDAGVFWTAATSGGALNVYACGAAGCADAGAPLVSMDAGITELGATGQGLYWITNGPTVWTCPLSNGGADCASQAHVLVVLPSSVNMPNGIVIDSTGIYWRDGSTYALMRVPLDGGAPESLASTPPTGGSGGLTLGSTCVFWSDGSDGGGLKAIAK